MDEEKHFGDVINFITIIGGPFMILFLSHKGITILFFIITAVATVILKEFVSIPYVIGVLITVVLIYLLIAGIIAIRNWMDSKKYTNP